MQIIRQKNYSFNDEARNDPKKQSNWIERCAMSLFDIASKDPKTLLDPDTLFIAPTVYGNNAVILVSENIAGENGSSVICMNPSEAVTLALHVITIMVGYGAMPLSELSDHMKKAVEDGQGIREKRESTKVAAAA